ncbi:MAG: class I SAM-dependent methyltransferase [Candidatus Odinarchaeia archaeon]
MEDVCLKVPKAKAECARRAVLKLGFFDDTRVIESSGDSVYIPLISQLSPEADEILRREIGDFKVEYRKLKPRKKMYNVRTYLEAKLPGDKLGFIPKSIDIIGEIAVVEIPEEIWEYRFDIGEAILNTHKHVKSVFAKLSGIEGEFRVRKLTHIAGEYMTETIHREYNCFFKLDVLKVYFSPRLGFEHWRVANLVKDSEVVFDMFAGVGPFSIMVAKLRDVKVYACDINPASIHYLKENIKLNKVEGKVIPIQGDAGEIAEKQLRGSVDRVIMNLPGSSIQYIEQACRSIKSAGGVIHYYTFSREDELFDDVLERVEERIKSSGREISRVLFKRKVRPTAPYVWQIVLDIEIV